MSKLITSDDEAKTWAAPKIEGKRLLKSAGTAGLNAELTALIQERVNLVKEQAYKEAFNKGLNDGTKRAQDLLNEKLEILQTIMNSLSSPMRLLDNNVEQELVNLCVAIAKQIVRRELKTDPGQVVAVVREALTVIPSGSRHVRVLLNQEDAIIVRKIIPENAGERTWEILEDPTLTRGSCKVETETTQVDATFETRIAAIAAELLGSERQDN